MRRVWRIATDTRTYQADDLSGMGPRLSGGRWNEAGTPVVYASETRALACLETMVHLLERRLPLNRYLVAITIPDDVWQRAEHIAVDQLKVGWDAEPPGAVSITFGNAWLTALTSAILVVPSVVVPEEFNVLINPDHEDGRRITAEKVRKWTYDARLRP